MMLYASLWMITLGYLSDAVIGFSTTFLDDEGREHCIDKSPWCSKLGRKLSLARCYDPRQYSRCCATCDRLRLPMPDCQFGDREPYCSTIGEDKPTADCYAHNKTCCQTCHLFDSGIPGCPFGDRATWCSGIGDRYSVHSCYDHEIHCCETCRQYRTGIAGCPYGDRAAWCNGIGQVFPIQYCASNKNECCQTCHRLQQQGYSFEGSETTTVLASQRANMKLLPSQNGARHSPTHSPLQRTNTASTNEIPSSTPPIVNPEKMAEDDELLTVSPFEGDTVFRDNGTQKHHGDDEVSEKEIMLSRKPSINVTKSITDSNDTWMVISGTTVKTLGEIPHEKSSTRNAQTEVPSHSPGDENPSINRQQDRNTPENDLEYLGNISPTSSSKDFMSRDRTNRNNSIDPGGSHSDGNRFKNSTLTVKDSTDSLTDIVLHTNISQMDEHDLDSKHQNTSQINGNSDKEYVRGISSGACAVSTEKFQISLVVLFILTFVNSTLRIPNHTALAFKTKKGS